MLRRFAEMPGSVGDAKALDRLADFGLSAARIAVGRVRGRLPPSSPFSGSGRLRFTVIMGASHYADSVVVGSTVLELEVRGPKEVIAGEALACRDEPHP